MTIPASEQPSATTAAALAEPLLPQGEEQQQQQHQHDPVVELASDPSEIFVHQVHVEGSEGNNESETSAFIDDPEGIEHGEFQAPACRDAIFAVLFILQAGFIVTLACLGIYNLSQNTKDWQNDDAAAADNDLPNDIHPTRVLLFLVSTIGSIMVLSAMILVLLLSALAEMMIQFSLVISPLGFGLTSIVMLVMGNVIGAVCSGILTLFGIIYAVRVWHRIPYAAANVATAVQAIHANRGVLPTAYIMTLATTIWTILWFFALGQVSVVHSDWVMECTTSTTNSNNHDDEDTDCDVSTRGKWILVGLLFSLFWTIQVLKNVFQVTIAGVVGTWWFAPEDCSRNGGCCGCCSAPLADSWGRATFYSLGSVCFGSLVVALLQVLKFLVRLARQQQEDENRRQGRQQLSILWCILQCIVDLLERLVKYINQWSFVYVGLYGYDYWTSSKKVYQLFRARGWSVILNDQLVNRSLGMMQLFIGIISGAIGVVFSLVFQEPQSPVASFVIGLILGMSLADIVLQVVSSAVNTIVVCFAESPNQLQLNHPESSDRLLQAWRSAYPSEFTF